MVTSHRARAAKRQSFICASCRRPFTPDDFSDFGLRIPEPDESPDDYAHAELLDSRSLRHLACLRDDR